MKSSGWSGPHFWVEQYEAKRTGQASSDLHRLLLCVLRVLRVSDRLNFRKFGEKYRFMRSHIPPYPQVVQGLPGKLH
jgi:hypothetical protein